MGWDLHESVADLAGAALAGFRLRPFHLQVTDDEDALATWLLGIVEEYCVPTLLSCLTPGGFLEQFDRLYRMSFWQPQISAVMAALELGATDTALDRIAGYAATCRSNGWEPGEPDPVYDEVVTRPFQRLTGYLPEQHPDFESRVAAHLKSRGDLS
jgi:hypothetical protein